MKKYGKHVVLKIFDLFLFNEQKLKFKQDLSDMLIFPCYPTLEITGVVTLTKWSEVRLLKFIGLLT